jgi:methionyl-tRNA formyltransferase
MIELFVDNYAQMASGEVQAVPQEALARPSLHYAAQLDRVARIDLERTYKARELIDLIRARSWTNGPSATFVHDGKTYYIRVQIHPVPPQESATDRSSLV